MEPIPIFISERAGLHRRHEPVRLGIPLQKGQCTDINHLQLTSQDGKPLPTQCRPLLHWPDGSVRWVLAQTIVSMEASTRDTLHLELSEKSDEWNEREFLKDDANILQLPAGSTRLIVDKSSLAWWLTDEHGNQHEHTSILLEDVSGQGCTARVSEWRLKDCGNVATELEARGWWHTKDGAPLARFQCNLVAYSGGQLSVDVCIHNPKRAKHPGGLWDLGDPGSIHFGALSVHVQHRGWEKVRFRLGDQKPDTTLSVDGPMHLLQESSGGENWRSRNHINAAGEVLPQFRGYQLTGDSIDPVYGHRASPTLECLSIKGDQLSAAMPYFWQNFPSALSVDQQGLSLYLFPRHRLRAYELQGGERKTQRVVLAYRQPLEALSGVHSPLIPVLPAATFESTRAFPWFRAHVSDTPLEKLIRQGLEGPDNFFRKREHIDEFGWRNFGDLFADHETLYQNAGEPPYISHYNNQYDAIYGFARQFACSGDPRWFELMDDLARHVADIDIYHTEEDRAEYNHGLFWHTDHYLDAHTCTHRTFTRHNNSSSTPGQLGGGPAAEHCYTTGLLYHHLLTGAPASRNAVLELASWMHAVHQGGKGLLAQVLAVKKQELPKLRAMLRGHQVSAHRFPFTRGTGNYLNTLLDAYLLEPCGNWLEQAERVIRQTIHPADDVGKRELLDTEIGWSYLVLLASIARYLYIKEEAEEKDYAWQFARDSLLHYTEWMLHHERPFLADPADLEYANETWTAQDIRKAMLMYLAAKYDSSHARQYRQKAEEWLDYVTTRLISSPEHHFTRIQVILLQNYGPHLLDASSHSDQVVTRPELRHYQAPSLSWPALLGQIMARLLRGLIHFRPGREKAWLQARLDR